MNKQFVLVCAPEDEKYATRLLDEIKGFSLARKYSRQCPHAREVLSYGILCSITSQEITKTVRGATHLVVLCTPALMAGYEEQANCLIRAYTEQDADARKRIIPVVYFASIISEKVDNQTVEKCMPRLLLKDDNSQRGAILAKCIQKDGKHRVVCDVAAQILGLEISYLPLEKIKASLYVAGFIIAGIASVCTYLKVNNIAVVPGLQLLVRGIGPAAYEAQIRQAAESHDDEMLSLLLSACSEKPEVLTDIALLERSGNAMLETVLRRHFKSKLVERLLSQELELLSVDWENSTDVECALKKKLPECWQLAIQNRDSKLIREILLAGDYLNIELNEKYGSPLHFAVSKGDAEITSLLLKYGARLDSLSTDSRLPIDCAGCDVIISLLKSHAMSLLGKKLGEDVTDDNYQRLIGSCAPLQFVEVYAAMITAGFDMMYHMPGRENPVVTQARQGRLNLVEYMVTRQLPGNVLNTALVTAAHSGQADVIRCLLEHGADVNAVEEGEPVLITAINSGSVESVRALLEKKPKMDCRNPFTGFTVITHAAVLGRYDMIKLLYDSGADMKSLSPTTGYPPLATTVFSSYVNCAKSVTALMECGADINEKSGVCESTALMLALNRPNSSEEVVSCLLSYNPDLTITDKTGRTALHYAIKRNKPEMVKMLLDAKAPIDLTKGMDDVLYCAVVSNFAMEETPSAEAQTRNLQIIQYLIDAGADVNGQVLTGSNLDAAMARNRIQTAELLLRNGAKLAKCQRAGAAALGWAIFYDNTELIDMLKDQNPEPEVLEEAQKLVDWLRRVRKAASTQTDIPL